MTPKTINQNQPFNKGSSNLPPKTPTLTFPNPQTTQTLQKAFTPQNWPNPIPMNLRRCFKCQGLGNITLDCPNWKVITLAEWEAVNGDEVEEEKEEGLDEEEEKKSEGSN